MFCKCGEQIPVKRTEFLENRHLPITCINCSDTTKVGGFMTTEGKTERTLIIGEMPVIEELHRISNRTGFGIPNGMKT